MGIPHDALRLLMGASICAGVIQCFYGYRLFKLMLWMLGFAIGAGLVGSLGYGLSGEPEMALLAGLIGGFVGGILLLMLHFVGIFLMGGFLGGSLGVSLYAIVQSNPEPAVLLVMVVIGGVVALIAQKIMIILFTGFAGSWLSVTGIAYFLTKPEINYQNLDGFFHSGSMLLYVVLLCWVALGIVGVVVQYKTPDAAKKKSGDAVLGAPRAPDLGDIQDRAATLGSRTRVEASDVDSDSDQGDSKASPAEPIPDSEYAPKHETTDLSEYANEFESPKSVSSDDESGNSV